MPTDHPRPYQSSGAGAVVSLPISAETGSALTSLCESTRSTLFMALQATLATLLSRYTGQTDIVLGTPVANRRRKELTQLMGFFVNTLVLRNQLDPHQDFNGLLAKTKCLTLDALSHQDLPFEQLVECLAPERASGHSPLFQVMFSWDPSPEQ